ncbi:MAG: glycyl-radical enzyme activating protein [Fastidiosipila sp.]|nr:glycyl-radical enzyme activating protein [Fastidiosipila sp.]
MSAESKARIFNIERFGTEDGPGIRTVIFLKGCGLKCLWCSNPESQNIKPEIVFLENACIACGKCVEVCPQKAVSLIAEYGYITDHSKCDFCRTCVENCLSNARNESGKLYTENELMEIVLKDASYYDESGGGVTFSGGEPLLQAEFIRSFSEKVKLRGYNTLVETCGYVSASNFRTGLSNVEYVYFDIKHMDPDIHKELTGQTNELILQNLRFLDEELVSEYSLRYPVIPQKNDTVDDLNRFFNFAVKLKRVKHVVLLPYHRLGATKYNGLGRPYLMGDTEPLTRADIVDLRDLGLSYELDVLIG